MDNHEDGPYWDRACQFFRSTGAAASEGSYFIHNKNDGEVAIGIGCRVSVSVDRGALTRSAGGRTTVSAPDPDGRVVKQVERLLQPDAPCFFVVSPDLRRRSADPALPLVRAVQPAVEFRFSADEVDGVVGFSADEAAARRGRDMLRSARADPPASPADDVPASFTELIDGWVPDEEDGSFLARLTDAVRVLQGHPDGKLTLTRAFTRAVSAASDPFGLYARHARVNGDYACSHYFCLREGAFSVGTTPENVFQIDHGTLTVDVVAATCRYSDDDEYLARELYDNPKQLKEHRSSLVNRQNRFRPFCVDGSIRVVQDMRVKALRNVCHLHSVFAGALRPDVTVFDLVENAFPLLGARPRELLAVADPDLVPHRYYGGVVGRVHGAVGAGFLNIRNALLVDGVAHAKVGVGVLAESDPSSELLETRDKLSGLLDAVAAWQRSG